MIASTDCNDADAGINPAAVDIPDNGIDENCDGNDATDFVDNDGDGVTNETDCDDNDATVYPGATEICDDKDNNCDGNIDEGLALMTYFLDADNDGFGDPSSVFESCQTSFDGAVSNSEDCDDNNPDINPDAEEIVNNGIDEDCDGMDQTTATHELSKAVVNIFPNPAVDLINIVVDGSLYYKVSLYDLQGRHLKTAYNKNKLSTTELVSGIYLLEIKDLKTRKNIVERVAVIR